MASAIEVEVVTGKKRRLAFPLINEERARELLDNLGLVRPDGTLGGTGKVYWPARYHLNLPTRPNEAELDGFFSADELEAIAWWIRNKATK